MQWLDTQKDIPNDGQLCLIVFSCNEGEEILLAKYRHQSNGHFFYIISKNVYNFSRVHRKDGGIPYWMPCPEIPKEKLCFKIKISKAQREYLKKYEMD